MRTSRSDLTTAIALLAAAAAACTGAVGVAGRDGGDASLADGGGDVTIMPDALVDATDRGSATDNSAYCVQFVDSSNQYYACSAVKCCDPFAACMHSADCMNVGACGVTCLAEAGDVGDKTAYCDDVCADVDTVGQRQRAAWSDCYDIQCRD